MTEYVEVVVISITIQLPQWWGRGLGFCENISTHSVFKGTLYSVWN